MASRKNKKKPAAGEKTTVYCGPSIKSTLKQFTVFQGELPAMVAERISENPLIGKLLVPVADLAKTRTAIATQGAPENIWYNRILSGGEA